MVRCGEVGQGEVRRGEVGFGLVSLARNFYEVRPGLVGHGTARCGLVRCG